MISFSEKYCTVCSKTAVEEKRIITKHYDKHSRDKKAKSFYNSVEWIKTRNLVLKKYHSLDIYDYYVNKKMTQANTVHHIEELSESWEKRLDIDNLMPLSSRNHNKLDYLYNTDKKAAQNMLRDLMKRFEAEFR